MVQRGELVHVPLVDVSTGPDQGLDHQDPIVGHGVAGALNIALRHIFPISESRS